MFLTGNAIRTARATVRCFAIILTIGLIAGAAAAYGQDSVIVGPPDDPYVVYGTGLPTTYTPTKSASSLVPLPVDEVNITSIDPSLFPEVCTSIEVLDSLGNPIPGFDVDSLCVYEDGIRIESFEVVETPIDSCFTSIALVIDVSGSMDTGDKIDSAKAAAHAFVDNMDLYDRVAIVKFSDCFEVVQEFTSDKTLLHSKITSLVAEGFTAAFDGIWKGVDITTGEFGSKAVIALSDGMENRSWLCPGGTDGLLDGFADDSTIIVSLARAASIPIYTISLGSSFDPKYLEALALGSGGFHSHAPTAGEIRDIYETIKFRLCSRYVICYTSPDLPDTCHTLRVCRQNAAGVCDPCDTEEYCEPKPPRIKLLVDAECHPANSDLHICARVNDSDTPRDSLDVKLFYRMSDADPYASVAMVHTYLDTFCYVLPGYLFPSCLMDGVQFYATASDGRTTVADPTGAPFDYYEISICKGDPPICDVPNDTTIFQCDPAEVCLPVGCLDVTGARTGDPTLISGPGAIIDGEWCYTPSGNETVDVTVQCTDTCGQTCEGSFTVTFDMNDAPVCEATSSTGSPLCVPPVHIVTFETTDADDNLVDCVVYGDGELVDHSWQIIAPVPGQSVSARVVCYDACRDSCWIDIEFTFPNPVPPVCNLPNDTTIVMCETAADSLPVSATAGAVCELIDGPGELRNGYWVHTPDGSEQVSVTIECTTECDTCGGTFRVTYVVNEPPVLSCQGSTRVECSDDLPLIDPLPPQIDDEDPASVILSPPVFDTIPGDCEDRFTVEITWIGTDECGAADTCTDVIEVYDTTPPYFVGCPDPITPECGTAYVMPPPMAEDNCDDDVTVTIVGTDSIPGNCFYAYTRIIVWEAMDNCGNVDTCRHVYNIVDNTPPMIECPDPITYECDAIPAEFPEPTATDLCDPNPVITEIGRASSTTSECPQGYHLTIMWEAMDACGNADTCTQVIDVVDTTPPEMTCGPDTSTFPCNAAVQPAPPDATDNCDPAPIVTMGSAVRTPDPECPSGYLLVVPWEAVDACGNVAACTTYFKAVDDLPPTIECPPPSRQYCGPNTPPIPAPNVLDDCDLDPTVWLERTDLIEGSCPQAYTAHLIWMAEDDCGNVDSCTQVIEYYDDQPPDCDGHPPLFYSCDAVPAVFPLPLALDECDPDPQVILVSRDSTGGPCPNSYMLALNYDFVDACGNSSSHTQFVEVSDTTKPYGITPMAVTYNCDDDIDPLPPPTGLDNCDPNPTVTLIDSWSGGAWNPCPQQDSIWALWQVEDACGNTNTFTQIIAIIDIVPPEFECGGPDTLQCTDRATARKKPTATDNCDPEPVVEVIDEIEIPDPNCPQAVELVTTYEARDACGNSTTCVLHTFFIDTLPPQITCLPPATLNCERSSVLPPPQVYDECDPNPTLRINRIDTIPGLCAHTYTEHIYWEAEDACGNIDSCMQVIDYVDNQPPTCNGHDPLFYDCDAVPDVFPEPLVMDNCDPDPQLQLVGYDSAGGNCPNSYTLMLHWVATDDCDNSSDHTVEVFVQDTTRPQITCPNDTIVPCEDFDGAGIKDAATVGDPFVPYNYEFGEPSATDNCDPNPTYGLRRVEQLNDDPCDTEYRLTFGAFDACGNFDSCFQIVHVMDTTAPVCDVPNDTTIFVCEPGKHLCLPVSATDACGSQVFCRLESGPGTIGIDNQWCYVASVDETFTVVVICEDDCGNECQDEFTVTIRLNEPPSCNLPNDTTLFACRGDNRVVTWDIVPTDPDGNLLTCEWRIGTGPAKSGLTLDIWPGQFEQDSSVWVTAHCIDSCGLECFDSFNVFIDVNDPPVCEFPGDTSLFACEPGDTLWLALGSSDPDDNLDSCTIIDGPGGMTDTNWYYVVTVEEEFDVTLACFDSCGTSCEGSFHVTINLNDPPFVEAPDDTTIFLCGPDTICLGPWPQIDLDYNIMNRWVNFGWMDPPSVCFIADTPGVYIIDDCLEDSCGLVDCDTAIITVIFNSPPVCEVPNDTTIVVCEPAEICLPISTYDPDGNLAYCENVTCDAKGDCQTLGTIDQWCYTPQVDETVVVTIRCVDSCGAVCESSFEVTFDIVAPPICEFPADTFLMVCDSGTIISLPYSVDDPDEGLDSCFITSGPGALVNGAWEYETSITEKVCVGVACVGLCGETCIDSFCVTIRVNEPPFVESPGDTSFWLCNPGDTVCLGPWPQIDFDYNFAERFVHFGWMDPPSVCFIADTPGVYIIDDCLTDSCGLTDCDTAYVTIRINTPPVCYVPNDTTITMCTPGEVRLPYDATDADDNLRECIILDGPGILDNGMWVYTPTRDTTVCVTIECTDECETRCASEFCVTFEVNDPPVCEVPNDTIIYQCEPTEVRLPVSALDEDDNLVGCELIDGSGKIEDGYWIYTPLGDEVICNVVRCTDECDASCEAKFCVIFEINDPPVCALPNDTTIVVCDVKEICLPVGFVGDWKYAPGTGGDVRIPSRDKDDGRMPTSMTSEFIRKSNVPTVCTILSGPGYISNGMWCYTPPERDTMFTVTVECRDTCDATCEGSFTVTLDVNEGPVCEWIDLIPPPPCPSPAAIVPMFFSSYDPDGGQTTCTLYVDAGNVTMNSGFVEIEHIPGDSVDFTIVCRDVCSDSCVLTMAFRFPTIQKVVCPDVSSQDWFRCNSEPDSVLVGGSCELIGDVHGILRNGWWVYTPTVDESFKVELMCLGLCDTCYTDFTVDIDINEPPTCWIRMDGDTAHYWFCEPEEICILFGGTDPDENLAGCDLASGPGTVSSGDGTFWCYTPQPETDEIFEVTIRCVDECGAESFCSFFVDIDMNEPPACESRNDTTIFLCEPTQICLPIGGATDPDNNLKGCYWLEDPQKTGNWCYFAQTEETVPVVMYCEDYCGAFCMDTFNVTFDFNEAPVCVVPNDTTIFLCEPTELCFYPAGADDPDGNLQFCGIFPHDPEKTTPGGDELCFFADRDTTVELWVYCYDSCSATCRAPFQVTIQMNQPPVCEFQTPDPPACTPPLQVVFFTSTDPEGGDVNCTLDGPGELFDGGWQYIPTPGEHIAVSITCTDACGAECTIGWEMTFPARVPPICEFPNDTTIVACIGDAVALPAGAGAGATCEITNGPGTLSDGLWHYTMTQEETITVSILCVSETGCDSCSGSFSVTFEEPPPPTITFDGGNDQGVFLCGIEQLCFPYTASEGALDMLVGSLFAWIDEENDRVCFSPEQEGIWEVVVGIKGPCGSDIDTLRVNVAFNEPPVCSLPNDTAIAACDVGTVCLPVSATDSDGNLTGCAVTGGPGQIVDGQWCYTPTESGQVTVTVTCTDDCGATCSGSFTVDFDVQGAAPVCNLPRDTTILLCSSMKVCLPVSATDPDGGDVTCTKIAGSGTLADGYWCYTPPADQEVTATIRCSDECGNYCEGTFSVLFDINDAPSLTVPEEISEVICGTEEICVPITVSDQNGNLASVTVIEGPGSIISGSWCYTPPAYDQTIDVKIKATDACGLSTTRIMRVHIDYNAVPVCDLPPNGYLILCEAGQVCLTFSEVDPASVGVTCTITDGPGTIQGGQWCYNATTREVVSLTLRCTNPCGDVCTVNRTYTIEIDPNECVAGPAAVPTPSVRVAGDLNNTGTVDVLDLVLLTRQLNRPVTTGAATPAVTTAAVRRTNTLADVNCDGFVTEADVVYLAAYLFENGPAPCSSE